jgi:hypothetical protein
MRPRASSGLDDEGNAQQGESAASLDAALRSCCDHFFAELPKIIRALLVDYQAVVSDVPLDDTKRFASCHLAGRSALIHLQELLRLAERLGASFGRDDASISDPDIDDLLRQARVAMRDLRGDDEIAFEGDALP